MLTARAEESERIVGLELGADDYLAKPFSPNELVARVRALLRRAQRGAAADQDARLRPDRSSTPSGTSSRRTAATSTLTAKEFLLLEYLLQHRGRVLSRDVLLTDVWGYRYTGGTRTVDVHVRRLREKLPLLADGLVTVKQFGYKLVDPVVLSAWRRRRPRPRHVPDQVLLRRALGRGDRAGRRRRAVRDDDAPADRRADRADAGGRSAAGRRAARRAASPLTSVAAARRRGRPARRTARRARHVHRAPTAASSAIRRRRSRRRRDGEPRAAARGRWTRAARGLGRVAALQRDAEDRHAVRRGAGAPSGDRVRARGAAADRRPPAAAAGAHRDADRARRRAARRRRRSRGCSRRASASACG